MKILFWGTPAYAVPSLEALVAAGHTLVGVVTQPDRRRGRGKELMPSPVKARALELGIPVFTPERIRRDPECQRQLADLGADVSVVVAFGQILPPEVLNQQPLGCWNGHGSLLPRWRGAGPIQWSLIEGDATTGVGIMAMEEGLDTGPVLLERSLPIGLLDNAAALGSRLSQLTASLLVEALPRIAQVLVDELEDMAALASPDLKDLALTMAPFAIVAPFLGPLLDRSRGGRRLIMILCNVLRGVVCLFLAVHIHDLGLYPLALLSLVLAKAQGITKNSLVPSVVNDQSALVLATLANLKALAFSGQSAIDGAPDATTA